MYKRRLKNRAFKTTGPLQKMINDAVEERMSALRKEGEGDAEPVWSDYAEVAREKLEDGRTKITERRTGTVPGGKDDYDGSGGYMPDDAWQEFLDSPDGQEYQKKYGPKELEEERVRFLETIQPVESREVGEVQPLKPEPRQIQQVEEPMSGENSFAAQLGLDLSKYANKRGSSNFAQRLADDSFESNPFSQYLQGYIRGGENSGPSVIGDRFNEKTNKKLMKGYETYQKRANTKLAKSKDFNQWLLTHGDAADIMMKDKGFKQLLDENPDVRTGNLFQSMFSDSYSRENFDEGFDPKSRDDVEQKKYDRDSGQFEYDPNSEGVRRRTGAGDKPATNMKRKPLVKMLQGRTMSFRKNKF